MSKVYKGGLTGGNIMLAYWIEFMKEIDCTKVGVEVHYNGKIYYNVYTYTYEILSGEDKNVIRDHLEFAVMQTVSEAIVSFADIDGMADKVQMVNSGKGVIKDEDLADDPLKNFSPSEEDKNFLPEFTVDENGMITYEIELGGPSYTVSLESGDGIGQNHPIAELLAACPALEEEVKYPHHLDPEADWPPQESDPLRSVIINLNDRMQWSFDQIADWLESLSLDINIDLESLEGGES